MRDVQLVTRLNDGCSNEVDVLKTNAALNAIKGMSGFLNHCSRRSVPSLEGQNTYVADSKLYHMSYESLTAA